MAKPAKRPAVKKPAKRPKPVRNRSVWDDLAMCESSGDWHINSGNGFYGGLQFWQPTWEMFRRPEQLKRADLADARAADRDRGGSAAGAGLGSLAGGCSKKLGLADHEHLLHTVRAGETLAGIARDYGVAGGWRSLYTANRAAVGADPDVLSPGVVLTVG